MQRLSCIVSLVVLAVGIATGGSALAQSQRSTPSAIYVFGDSLSDRGNLAEVYYHNNLPNPPSYHDSFTNGNVAVQTMASRIGLSVEPSLWVTNFQDPYHLFSADYTPGTNYAVAGATAAAQAVGGFPSINLPQQIGALEALTGGLLDPNALYTVFIGGNDVRDAAKEGTGLSAINTGVQTEIAGINTLLSSGAKNLLVVNVPNIGAIPEFSQFGLSAVGTQYSQAYDSQLSAGLAAITIPSGSSVGQFDFYSYASSLSSALARQGFDMTDPCYVNTPVSAVTTTACGTNAENIGKLYYWDSIHPTAAVDNLVGNALADFAFGTAPAVPEPASWALMIFGFAAVGVAIRRRKTGISITLASA